MPNDISQWNEQQMFSRIFFWIHAQCRLYQSLNKVNLWKQYVESKMSHVMSVSNEKEKIRLRECKRILRAAANSYYSVPQESKRRLCIELAKFKDTLFDIESEIDGIANIHMPFLNIERQPEIDDW